MPSRSANSIHVARMCEAFLAEGHELTLFFRRSVKEEKNLRAVLEDYYGVDLRNISLISFFGRSDRGTNVRIALIAFRRFIRGFALRGLPDLVISRNLYASFLLGVLLRYPLVFESHELEQGSHRFLQGALIKRPWITTLLISKALEQLIIEQYGLNPRRVSILPDAAPSGIKRLSPETKRALRAKFLTGVDPSGYKAFVGYFGHLYPGRGIELIKTLAERCPNAAFLLFGGNDTDVKQLQEQNSLSNLYVMGHVKPSQVSETMGIMDVLLMPYQRRVSIGKRQMDTARWMSPMKMFEYMASGVPIIASKLPALTEILEDGRNCLMVDPEDPDKWLRALELLINDGNLGEMLGAAAHEEYMRDYTWKVRARKLLAGIDRNQ